MSKKQETAKHMQPWEMTQSEFRDDMPFSAIIDNHGKIHVGGEGEEHQSIVDRLVDNRLLNGSPPSRSIGWLLGDIFVSMADASKVKGPMHKLFVAKAIEQGKYIPEHVLNEYSDLSKHFNEKLSNLKIASKLFQEDETRIQLLKKASVEKQAMAAMAGIKEHKNSFINVKWNVFLPTARMEKIAQEITAVFQEYLSSKVGGKKVTAPFGAFYKLDENTDRIEINDNDSKIDPAQPDANLVLRFQYYRDIMPINNEEYNKNAQNSVKLLDSVLPHDGKFSFSKFIEALKSNNISLLPFYHTTEASAEMGGFSNTEALDKLQGFIMAEQSRAQNLKMPNGESLPFASQCYANQVKKIQNGNRIMPTSTFHHKDVKSRDAIFTQITTHGALMNAIAHKVGLGYKLNTSDVKAYCDGKMSEWASYYGADKIENPTVQAKFDIVKERYTIMYNKIVQSWKRGCTPKQPEWMCPKCQSSKIDITGDAFSCRDCGAVGKSKEAHVDYYPWGSQSGLPAKNKGHKTTSCPMLTTEELQVMLFALTSGKATPSKIRYNQLNPDEVYVPGEKIMAYSNGWDTVPSKPGQRMSTIPSIRMSNGNIVYDSDNINLGHYHLALAGRKVQKMLEDGWGEWCDRCLKALRNPQGITPAVQSLFKAAVNGRKNNETNDFSLDAWSNVIGGYGQKGKVFGNRTNAETLLDILSKYKTYREFAKGFLSKSLSSEFTGGDRFSEQMLDTVLSESGFKLLQQHGYQMSKMMDFTYAVMARCCEEIIERENKHGEVIQESFYGREYSASQGKGQYGTIMIGVKYAYNARFEGTDPQVLDKLRKEWSYRHIRKPSDEYGHVMRQTLHPQRGTPISPTMQGTNGGALIMEDITYWIGESSSESRWHKTVKDFSTWEQAISFLAAAYPPIMQLAEVEPINVNMKFLERQARNAVKSAEEKLGKSFTQFAPTIVNNEGAPAINTGTQAVSPPQQPQQPQQPQIPQQLSTPTQPALPPNQTMPEKKSMKANFISRKNTNRSLIKKEINQDSGKLRKSRKSNNISSLLKLSDTLDILGHHKLADKVDILISKIKED